MEHGIGLVGCGGIAGSWIKAVAAHDDCQILLTCDLVEERAARRAAEAGARPAASMDDVLGSDHIDVVIVATPTGAHPALTEQAARAGKHVLSEKPMALSVAACRGMVEACEATGVRLAIGQSLRFWSAFLKARELVAQGAIGTPVSGSIDRMGVAAVRRAGEPKPSRGWRDDVANTGGALMEGYVHEIDFARSIFGDAAAVVCQLGGGREHDGLMSPDIAQAVVRFESGAVVTMRTGGVVGLPARGYWVGGTEAGLGFTEWGGPVELHRPGADGSEEVACEPARAYYRELCDLVQAIESGGEPENGGLNGLKNVALALGLYRSVETGRRVEFADGLPQGMPEDYRNTTY